MCHMLVHSSKARPNPRARNCFRAPHQVAGAPVLELSSAGRQAQQREAGPEVCLWGACTVGDRCGVISISVPSHGSVLCVWSRHTADFWFIIRCIPTFPALAPCAVKPWYLCLFVGHTWDAFSGSPRNAHLAEAIRGNMWAPGTGTVGG